MSQTPSLLSGLLTEQWLAAVSMRNPSPHELLKPSNTCELSQQPPRGIIAGSKHDAIDTVTRDGLSGAIS
jgi:hypothetical protein